MRKFAIFSSLGLLISSFAHAAVVVNLQPVSLITSATTVSASSAPLAVMKFSLTSDAAETLSSVAVTINATAGSTVSGSDLAEVAVYKDANGNGTFEAATDNEAGSESNVNVGSSTTVTTSSHNTLSPTATFFVTIKTDASWSGSSPVDSIRVTLGAGGVDTSANDPTVIAVTTSTIAAVAADETGPELTEAEASKTSGGAKQVKLTFDEATNKPTINDSNIDNVLDLNNSHSWLDGAGDIGSATWSSDGKVLTVVLSAGTSAPTIVVGDTVTISNDVIEDASGNEATGSETITGDLTQVEDDDDEEECDEEEEEDCEEDEGVGKNCANTLINGRLYKLAGENNTTVYLAAACRLKPFRGAAVFHARGHKFQNIITLSSLAGFEVSSKPALPAAGTLVKGSDKTVWFIAKGHKRKGFASEKAFLGLGFKFNQVNQISDSDLNTIPVDSEIIADATKHPRGTLVKCTNSTTVSEVDGSTLTPFANAESFFLRGHKFEQVAEINCTVYRYTPKAPITE